MLNAKYVISCARKVGACVFLTPEDIVEVRYFYLCRGKHALYVCVYLVYAGI